jgi:hypothetical protein
MIIWYFNSIEICHLSSKKSQLNLLYKLIQKDNFILFLSPTPDAPPSAISLLTAPPTKVLTTDGRRSPPLLSLSLTVPPTKALSTAPIALSRCRTARLYL